MLERVRRPELERLLVKPRSGRIGVEGECAIAGVLEGVSSARLDRLCRLARRTSKLERARVMVREHFRVVVGTSEGCHPFRCLAMLVGSRSTRDLPVRDVARENVSKRVLGFVGNGRLPRALDESLAFESV